MTLDIIPNYEGRECETLPVVTVTILDSAEGEKTFTFWGAVDVKVFDTLKQAEDGPKAARKHVRVVRGKWVDAAKS
jgi:hypothetical protein